MEIGDIQMITFKTKEGNNIWAGALVLAWKEFLHFLCKNGDNSQIQLSKGQNVADKLTSCPFGKQDLNEKSIFVYCEKGQQAVDYINKGLLKKFPQVISTDETMNINLAPTQIISYAMIYHKISFNLPFEKRKTKQFLFKGKPVESFYTHSEIQRKNIFVNKFVDPDNFIIGLADKNSNSTLYLLKLPEENLKEEQIFDKIKTIEEEQSFMSMQETDFFEMPIIDIDQNRTINEIKQASIISPKQHGGLVIAQISQAIKLRIDESGATMVNTAFMYTNESSILNYHPKIMKLDKTFWIVMKEQLKYPFLCAKIQNL